MPLKIIRNDITKIKADAIVNTANENPVVGPGCDEAIYRAAGYDKLLKYRTDNIGKVEEGNAFITPGFNLNAKYIIHAVSPLYVEGLENEAKLRNCYRNSLALALDKKLKSVAFPLISTGSFGYPKEEGLRIAVDEINGFLLIHDMLVYLVVYDSKSTDLGRKLIPDLESYIEDEYIDPNPPRRNMLFSARAKSISVDRCMAEPMMECSIKEENCELDFEELDASLSERLMHREDTFSEYLLYLIKLKGLENADVYKRAIVDKKTFSKIKNNPDYHPNKLTAMCLCMGARLSLDESVDLLVRAGYALSPCDKTDIIFKYFIENEIYDMIELDIQLEEHGLECIIK